jgi:predicted glutamine amidotransferase
MAFTTINYSEGNPMKENLGYESVEIHYGKPEKKKFFNTGNFVKDWFDLRKFQIMELSDKEEFFTHSSTVDHFIMDGAPYESAYLVTDEQEVSELCYGSDWYTLGIEFFVPEGTKPTWAELKEMCK